MATNPPITIGELSDVPAPGSGVKSAWSQEVTNRVAHRFATVVARDAAWPAATAGRGAVCVTLDTDTRWSVVMVGAVLTWVAQIGATAWTAVAYAPGWQDLSINVAGQQPVQYRKVGDVVELRGGAQHPTINAVGTTIFTLPTGFRPPVLLLIPSINGAGFLSRLDVAPTGAVAETVGQNGANEWIALNVRFSTVA